MYEELCDMVKGNALPAKANLLLTCCDLISVNSPNTMDLITADILGNQIKIGTVTSIDRLTSYVKSELYEILLGFDVTLSEDHYTIENMEIASYIISTLMDLDDYANKEDIHAILDSSDDKEEALAIIVSQLNPVEPEEVMVVVEEVTEYLIERIRSVNVLDNNDITEDNVNRSSIYAFARAHVTSKSTMIEHVIHNGSLGLTLESYVSIYGEDTLQLEPEEAARHLVMMILAANQFEREVAENSLDSLIGNYYDKPSMAMKVRKIAMSLITPYLR